MHFIHSRIDSLLDGVGILLAVVTEYVAQGIRPSRLCIGSIHANICYLHSVCSPAITDSASFLAGQTCGVV